MEMGLGLGEGLTGNVNINAVIVTRSTPSQCAIRLLSRQRVIGISWRIPLHRSPFFLHDQRRYANDGQCKPPPPRSPRAAFVVHFLRYYFAPSTLSFAISLFLHALLLLFSSLINFSLVFGSHKFPTLFCPLTLARPAQ